MIHTRKKLNTSERRTCSVLSVSRSSLHYKAKFQDNDALRLAMIRLAKQHGRYGYRKIAELLRIEGWRVNHKKVERLWREEGLKLPERQKSDGGCITKTARSFACDLRMLIMFGLSTLYTTN